MNQKKIYNLSIKNIFLDGFNNVKIGGFENAIIFGNENILSEKGVLSHDFYVLMGKKEAESAFCLICFWIFSHYYK